MAAPFYDLTLAGVIVETADTRSLVLDVPAELRERFSYRAGQFLTFEVPYQGMLLSRAYSLASEPGWDARPKVTVKRVEGGRVSNWMHDSLSVGDRVRVRPPEGRFVLREGAQERPLCLYGGGSGITPLISLAKAALLRERRVRLVYANRDAASVIFAAELECLQSRYPERLSVAHHLDSERGLMRAQDVARLSEGWLDADHYICGPGPLMALIEGALGELGVPRERVHLERFVSPKDPTEKAPAANTAGPSPGTLVLSLEGERHEVPLSAGQTLLQAAEAAGLEPPTSCEEGYCGCCMAKLIEGQVSMSEREALTDEDVAQGWIVPCCARPASAAPLVIDFDATY